MDCPLCGENSTLTPARIAYVRGRVADTEAFQGALKDAGEALAQMQAIIKAATNGIAQSLPLFITNPSRFRRARGFRVERIRALLGIDAKADIDSWLASLRRLVRAGTRAFGATKELAGMIAAAVDKPESLDDPAVIRSGFSAVAEAREAFAGELAIYDPAEKIVNTALQEVVDAQRETNGWQERTSTRLNSSH